MNDFDFLIITNFIDNLSIFQMILILLTCQIIMKKKLEIKSYFAVYAIGISAGLSSFILGYSHVFLSQLQKIIQNKNDLSLQQLALTLTIVVSATNFGEVIGPFMYRSLSQRFGEARTMINCHIAIIISVCLQLVELNIFYLLVGRITLGIIVGVMSSILPLYLNSIAPLSISGKICTLNQIMTCLGVIVAYLLGFTILEEKEDQLIWRVLVGFPIIPSLISIIGFKVFFPFDRIERHIQKKQQKILNQYLTLVYKNATIDDISQQKIEPSNIQKQAQYSRQYQRYIIAIVVIASVQLCGINGIFYYTKQLFREITNGDSTLSQKLMVGLSFCQAVGSLICSHFIDYFGRKYLIIRGQRALIIILFTIFVVDNLQEQLNYRFLDYTIIGLLYLHVIIFNLSLGPVCIIYAAQLVPNMTPIIVTLRFVTFLVALSTNYIIHEFGIGQLFLMFGVLSIVVYIFLQKRLLQTKGKSKPEIYQLFEINKDDSEQRIVLV